MNLIHGDAIEQMKALAPASVDLILTDPPYGILKDVKWDKVIDIEKMWEQVLRVLKLNGTIIFTSAQPFTSRLIMSNLSMFRYTMVWDKVNKKGFLNSSYRPLKQVEDIIVFSRGKVGSKAAMPMKYNPQGVVIVDVKKKNNTKDTWRKSKGNNTMSNQLNNGEEYTQKYTNHPTDLVKIQSSSRNVHPTQKPVALMEYLIKTYTNEGETVLDFTMGSGTTGVACINTNRDFTGIELDDRYFSIAKERVEKARTLHHGEFANHGEKECLK